ncbi:dolichol phosphate-mannose biosynthesis regulatory protein [Austrofundulus limnaeus]|uniref:Dolichol phosphate-mannose biosynthesis regulatory protein n=1 Tax=Austrofundulus limnaeus TaxID=52670 RepID=A0A2I4CST6_AUSLI|nr:PREDICTED: dolichol phosphate-mannose biosynthesis regulatory protein [Austrofundulus limnaeus]
MINITANMSEEENPEVNNPSIRGFKMASGADQTVGLGLVGFSLLLFSYYTVWVIVLPFVDSDHVLHKYFLPREFSVLLPGVAGVILLLCIAVFTAVVLLKNHKPKKVD